MIYTLEVTQIFGMEFILNVTTCNIIYISILNSNGKIKSNACIILFVYPNITCSTIYTIYNILCKKKK